MVNRNVMRKGLIILFWIAVWQLLSVVVDNGILMVSPWQTFHALLSAVRKMDFWLSIAHSFCRIGMGFLLGCVTGLGLAAVSSRCSIIEELLAPLMMLCKAIPVASFVVMLLIWWGASGLSVAICFLVVLPNVYISTLEGIKNTDKCLVEMAQVFHMTAKTKFFYVFRPALKPFVYSSLKVSLGMCWKSGVAAEVIGLPQLSIGEQLYLSKIYLETADVFAWTVVIMILSVAFEKIVLKAVWLFFAWEPICLAGIVKDRTNASITTEQLCKDYDGKSVLEKVSVLYEPGHIYYLSSPSGSGKTTFLRILCGLEQADKGKKEDGGMRYSMVFQENRLCEEYSAVRNVEMAIGDRHRARAALEELLEQDALDKPCSQLSGGMKRRVALVRAMESNSDCVLLDEPFTGLDAETRQRVEAYIARKQQGRIMIIATHI